MPSRAKLDELLSGSLEELFEIIDNIKHFDQITIKLAKRFCAPMVAHQVLPNLILFNLLKITLLKIGDRGFSECHTHA